MSNGWGASADRQSASLAGGVEMDEPSEGSGRVRGRSARGEPLRLLQHVVFAAGFWLAIVLPVVYMPLLLVPDRTPPGTVPLFLILHILALLAGHRYRDL